MSAGNVNLKIVDSSGIVNMATTPQGQRLFNGAAPDAEPENELFKFMPIMVVGLWAFLVYSKRQGEQTTVGSKSFRDVIKLVGAIALMFSLGPCLILLNRHILTDLKFNFPHTIALTGYSTTLIMLKIFRRPLMRLEGKDPDVSAQNADKDLGWDFYLLRVLPVGLCSVGALWFGMLSFPHLSVTYNEMLKATTPMLTFCGMLMCGVQRFNKGVFMSICMVSCGLALAIRVDGQATAKGILLMMMSCFAEAGRMTLLQVLLQDRRRSFTESLNLMLPTITACTYVLAIWLEFRDIFFDTNRMFPVVTGYTVALVMTSGTMGCILSVLTYWIVSQIGGLSLKALVCARSVALILFSVIFRGDALSNQGYIGYSVSILGLMFYHMSGHAYNKGADEKKQSVKEGKED